MLFPAVARDPCFSALDGLRVLLLTVLAPVVAAIHAVGDDGRSADDSCGTRHGGANYASAFGAGWS